MPKPLFSKLIVQVAIGLFCVLFGCIYGIHTSDKILMVLSLVIGICCLIRTVNLYQLIHSQSYTVLEGTCTKREPALLKSTQQILLTGRDNQEYRFSLDKSVKLLQGHYYRLYFRKSPQENDTAQSYQAFLGFEELASLPTKKT